MWWLLLIKAREGGVVFVNCMVYRWDYNDLDINLCHLPHVL